MQQQPAPPPYPGQYDPAYPVADAGARFREVCARYEIGPEYASKLRLLSDVDIVVVADDSGSMSSVIRDPEGDPFGRLETRWDELKRSLFQILDIALLFDRDGIDVYFLNRPEQLRGVTDPARIAAAFAAPPSGYTPLARTVQTVFAEKQAVLREKRLLCLICTDGEPTDDRGRSDVAGFRAVLTRRHPIDRIFVSIMACSDDDGAMAYLDGLDRKVPNVDVVDDYRSERRQVQRRDPSQRYSYGDHIVKTLVGALDPDMDRLDEADNPCCCLQ